MIYVDSCIPMYLIGSDHPNKTRVLEVLPRLVEAKEEMFTSAEAFQEIIHRYKSLRDSKHLQIAYEALEEMVSMTHDVTKADCDMARTLASRYPDLSSRDCLHVAIMKRIACHRVWTFDAGFDEVPFLQRFF